MADNMRAKAPSLKRVQGELRAYCNRTGSLQRDVAQQMGVSQSQLSLWFHGRLSAARAESFTESVHAWLHSEQCDAAGSTQVPCDGDECATAIDAPCTEERSDGGDAISANGSTTVPRTLSAYNVFLKGEIAKVKKQHPELVHREAFKRAAGRWRSSPMNPSNSGKRSLLQQPTTPNMEVAVETVATAGSADATIQRAAGDEANRGASTSAASGADGEAEPSAYDVEPDVAATEADVAATAAGGSSTPGRSGDGSLAGAEASSQAPPTVATRSAVQVG